MSATPAHLLETDIVHLQVDGVLQFIQQWCYVALTVHRIPEAMDGERVVSTQLVLGHTTCNVGEFVLCVNRQEASLPQSWLNAGGC